MSHIKTLKITPTCFDHQLIIIREVFDVGMPLHTRHHAKCDSTQDNRQNE
jgi:hypothetical protein